MRNAELLLRSILVFFLVLSAASMSADDKDCPIGVKVELERADGSVEPLGDMTYSLGVQYVSEHLEPGDTIVLRRMGSYGLFCSEFKWIGHAATYPDTASHLDPLVVEEPSAVMRVAQAGSFRFSVAGGNWSGEVCLFLTKDPVPLAVDLNFKEIRSPYSYFDLGTIDAGQTCVFPCLNVFLEEGEFVRMTPTVMGITQPGLSAVVRYASGGEVPTFGTSSVVHAMEYAGFSFSEEGIYLLTVEGPDLASSAFVWIRVSHEPAPRVDLSLDRLDANGVVEQLAYVLPYSDPPGQNVLLAPGEFVRIAHHAITEPCDTVRLVINRGQDWGPAYPNDPLVLDTLVNEGVLLSAPGSFLARHFSGCGVPMAQYRFTIDAPLPRVDVVLGVRHANGTQEEILRIAGPQVPTPHLQLQLEMGDSIRVHQELTGWCGPGHGTLLRVYGSSAPGPADVSDQQLTYGLGIVNDFSFSGEGNYYVWAEGGSCFDDLGIHITVEQPVDPDPPLPTPHVDLSVTLMRADGSEEQLAFHHGTAFVPGPLVQVDLLPGDSIRIDRHLTSEYCTDTRINGLLDPAWELADGFDTMAVMQPIGDDGYRFADAGSYWFCFNATGCLINSGNAHVVINRPPVVDLWVALVHADGAEELPLIAQGEGPTALALWELEEGDSLLVRYDVVVGECPELALRVHRNAEGDMATADDPVFHEGPIGPAGERFATDGRFLFLLDQDCGANTGRAQIEVDAVNTTGVEGPSANGATFSYVNGMLTIGSASGALLQVRNSTGQLVMQQRLQDGRPIAFQVFADGIYIATIAGSDMLRTFRFAVF